MMVETKNKTDKLLVIEQAAIQLFKLFKIITSITQGLYYDFKDLMFLQQEVLYCYSLFTNLILKCIEQLKLVNTNCPLDALNLKCRFF